VPKPLTVVSNDERAAVMAGLQEQQTTLLALVSELKIGATEAGVKTLVLSHFVPGGDPALTDEVWRAAVSPHFKGELVVARDLMEL
jgi:hypothetical protein